MLQQIRDKTEGWFTRVVIGLVCFAFILWGAHSFLAQSSGAANGLASVGNHVIIKAEFDTVYNRLRSEQQSQLGANFKMTDQVQASLKQNAMQQLVTSLALSQAALKEDLIFTPGQVGHVIAGISAFQENGHFSQAKFIQSLSALGFSEQDFFDNIRNAMLINQLRIGIVGSSFGLPGEVNQALQLINQKRDIASVIVSPQNFTSKAQVTDQDAKAFYQSHQTEFTTPESVTVQYLELSLPELAKNMHMSNDDLQQYYQANTDSFTVPAKWRLTTAFLAVDNNDAKAVQLAQQNMAKVVQALQAGANVDVFKIAGLQVQNTDWVNSKELSPEIAAGLKGVAINHVSAPIQTKTGILVAKVLAYQAAAAIPFEQAKPKIMEALAQQKASQQFADMNDKLNNLTYTNPSSLEPAAKALGLTVQTSDALFENKAADGLFSDPRLIAAAFSADVLNGNNSNLINLDDSHIVVLRVATHQKSQVKPFDTVKDEIMDKLVAQKAKLLANQNAQDIIAAVNGGKTLSHAANGLSVSQQSNVSRFTAGSNGSIINAAFQMPRPGKNPSVSEFTLPNGDVAIVQVLQVHADNDSAIKPVQQRVMQQQIASGYAQLEYQLYAEGVLSKADIKINQPSEHPAN